MQLLEHSQDYVHRRGGGRCAIAVFALSSSFVIQRAGKSIIDCVARSVNLDAVSKAESQITGLGIKIKNCEDCTSQDFENI